MRQKLITLDPTSFETASSMKNFSEWVRIQLGKYRDEQQKPLDDDLDAARFKLQHGRWPHWYTAHGKEVKITLQGEEE